MLYRVILDCRSSATEASQPFITVKFVNAETKDAAMLMATARTKELMKEKGFKDADISSFEFVAEEIELFDPNEVEVGAERSFIFYSDS